ncbi:MAG: hypothetical protein ACTSQE_16815 [Candidatus Heimdallarchaeaceae archaeon]
MEKKVVINGKEYTIKEIPYIEAVDLDMNNKKEAMTKVFKICAGLSDDEIKNLSLKEGLELERAIAELNGMSSEGFISPAEKKE